jgi:hypothetical protein
MISSLFTRNETSVKINIQKKFIKYFIYSNFDNLSKEKQKSLNNYTKELLIAFDVIFSGECVSNINSETIDIYIHYYYLVDFLLLIAKLSKTYNADESSNTLFEHVGLNLMTTSNINLSNPDSIYVINYSSNSSNKRLNIYVVNDGNIIDKINILNDKFYYTLKSDIITKIEHVETSFSLLTPSHVSRKKRCASNSCNAKYKDVILEIINYIPYYIDYDELNSKYFIIKSSINIYIYPIIWFALLIDIADDYTYNKLCHSYALLTSFDGGNKTKINSLITKIYINKLLYKYKIFLHIKDNEIKFINNEEFVDENIIRFIKLLLLFYYENNIYTGYSKYKFIQTINDRHLPEILFSLEETEKLGIFNSYNELIDHLIENSYEFTDIIDANDLITKKNIIDFIYDHEDDNENDNIFLVIAKKVIGISKRSLEKLIMHDNNIWLINCITLYNLDRIINDIYYDDLYIKLNFICGSRYISYKYIYALLNSTDKFYFIEKTDNIKETISHYNFLVFNENGENLNSSEINRNENYCQEGSEITNTIILKKIKINEVPEDFSIISSITTKNLSTIFNKKLLISDKKLSANLSSKRSKKGGKKSI